MVAVTIDGLDSLQKDMQKLQDQLGSGAGPVVSEALNAGADIMLAEIQSNARSELNLGSKRNALYPSLQKGRVKTRASGGSTIEIGSFMSAQGRDLLCRLRGIRPRRPFTRSAAPLCPAGV